MCSETKNHVPKEIFPGVFRLGRELLTLNLAPGRKVYGEKLFSYRGNEFRVWNPHKSKLAAAILCGLKEFAFGADSSVLYLGAATGTTASHVSDICKKGTVYCVEFSAFSMQSLVQVCAERQNMIPLLRDARMVQTYLDVGQVEVVYQDVAQPDQTRILSINCRKFLKSNGTAYLCLKAKSIDVSKPNSAIFMHAEKELSETFRIIQKIDISKFESDHMFYVLKLK